MLYGQFTEVNQSIRRYKNYHSFNHRSQFISSDLPPKPRVPVEGARKVSFVSPPIAVC